MARGGKLTPGCKLDTVRVCVHVMYVTCSYCDAGLLSNGSTALLSSTKCLGHLVI